MKVWDVRRVVEEIYEVQAETKKEAKLKIEDPVFVTVLSESIKLKGTKEEVYPTPNKED